MSFNKFHTRDLLHAVCTSVSLIVDVGTTLAPSVIVVGIVVPVVSTDAGIASGTILIALVTGTFSFLLSLVAVLLRAMIDVVLDLQKRRRRRATE